MVDFADNLKITNIKNLAKKIWIDNFKDDQSIIDFYFENIFKEKNFLINYKNNRILSSLYLNDYVLTVDNYTFNSKYIVAVATNIVDRSKGYMTELLLNALKIEKEKDCPLIYLSSINPSIHRRFNFEFFSSIENYKFKIEDLAELKQSKDINFITIDKDNLDIADEYLDSILKIYEFNMKSMNCYVERDKNSIKTLLSGYFTEDMKLVLAHDDRDYLAYMIYGLYGDKIEIREFFSKNYIVSSSLLKILYAYRDYYTDIELTTVTDSNIDFLFKNQLKIVKTINNYMMARILNPRLLFDKLEIKNIDLALYIVDDIFEENTGKYTFKEDCEFSKFVDDFDMKINISALVPLALGYMSVDELIKIGKIDLVYGNKLELIRKTFPKKNNYILEYI